MDVKPDAVAALQHYESERFWNKIRPLIGPIKNEFTEWDIHEKKLGEILRNLNTLMETSLGKEAKERPFVKLSAKLFRDFALEGTVHMIFRHYFRFLRHHHLQELHFLDLDHNQLNLEYLKDLKQSLEQAQKTENFLIYVDSSNGDRKSELENIIKALGGKVSPSPDNDHITHTVYSFGPDGDPDDGVQYLRSLEMTAGESFVHYWYYPDSFDNWMTADMAPENLEPDHKPIGPWKVYSRWLTDSQKFNEWMNPIDYETEEFQEDQEALRFQTEDGKMLGEEDEEDDVDDDLNQAIGSQSEEDMESMTTEETTQIKRKRDNLVDFPFSRSSKPIIDGISVPNKKQMTNDQNEVDQSAAVKIAPNVTKHKTLDLSKFPFDGPIKTIADEVDAETSLLSENVEFKRQVYTVPLHASWFEWDHIHEIEKEAISFLKEEGDSESTALMDHELYRTTRNTILNMFRAKPNRKLKFMDVRRDVLGDEESLRIIYEFLNQYGLINFFPSSNGDPSGKANFDNSEWESSVNLPNGAPPLVTFSNMISLSDTEAAITGGNELSYGLLSRPNKYGKTVMESGHEKSRIRCNAMPWVDCTDIYFHCTTHADVDLCPQAYQEGRFPTGTSAKDFVKVTSSGVKSDQNGWTDQETLLLLEAIELYGEDWAEIAEHVATKSQLQCSMQWLTMPIEDDIVQELLLENCIEEEEDISTTIPFADVQNPIMAQVAFLAAMVSPEVASAAAQEGLHVLSQEDVLNPGQAPIPSTVTAGPEARLTNGLFTSALAQQSLQSGINEDAIRKASAAALRSAAIKAKLLAEQQEREIKKLMTMVIDAQLKKLEIKLTYCKDQDSFLDDERTNFQSNRQQLHAERMQMRTVLSPEVPPSLSSSVGAVAHHHLMNNDASDQARSNGNTIGEKVHQNGH